jgi:hypothetical protein
MSGSADQPAEKSPPFSEAEERALDAMLSELFAAETRGPKPPRDFEAQVLTLVRQRSGGIGVGGTASLATGSERRGRAITLGAWASLAATILAMVYFWGGSGRSPFATNEPTMTASGGSTGSDSSAATNHTDAIPKQSQPNRKPPVLLSGSPASVDSDHLGVAEPGPLAGQAAADGSRSTRPRGLVLADTASSRPIEKEFLPDDAGLARLNQQFAAYWQAIGVVPAASAGATAWSDRIADRFGIVIDPTVDNSAGTATWSDRDSSQQVAERLVAQLAIGLRLDPTALRRLTDEAADVIYRGDRFDAWLGRWVRGEFDSAEAPQPADSGSVAVKPDALGEWFASRLAGADVGCARCHDSPIDSRYIQHDYWAIVALFSSPAAGPTFYELKDGRQRVATPGVSKRWLGLADEATFANPIDSRETLGQLLIGNRQVARTLANHLWSIGFGTPLLAVASSPIAPPRDDALDQALEMLAERLVASDFDIRAAVDWIINGDPMRRGLPDVFLQDRWQVAPEVTLAEASMAQRSFAAARAHWPAATRRQLAAMMKSRSSDLPTKIGRQDTLLAQPLILTPPNRIPRDLPREPVASGDAATAKPEEYWWAQWMADREGLRGGWIESIADRDQQLRHAFYAAGFRQVTPDQLRLAEDLIGSDVAQAVDEQHRAVAKLYWVIQNGS